MTALAPELLGDLVERAGRPDFEAFEAQLRSSGYCTRPVRLRGTNETCDADGRRRVWSTDDEPDRVLRKACGNRREAVCPSCAERYRQDAYHLIAAGLRGGKGVPDVAADHPAVFATLTAPSFEVVHSRALGPDGQPRRCRPRHDAPICEHGLPRSCSAIYDDGDPCLGEPLCPECFDYAGAVIWNNTLGELWRRTTIYVRRALARHAGMTQERLNLEVDGIGHVTARRSPIRARGAASAGSASTTRNSMTTSGCRFRRWCCRQTRSYTTGALGPRRMQ